MAYYSVGMELIDQGVENGGGDAVRTPANQRLVLLGVETTSHVQDCGHGNVPVTYIERKGGLAARFWTKVNLNGPIPANNPQLGPCWEWTAARTDRGYGSIWVNGRVELAHIASFRLAGHDIPDDLELDHLCRNRACVRFDHLEPVTHTQNMKRSPLILKHGRFTIEAKAERKRVPLTPEEKHERYLRQLARQNEKRRQIRSTPEGRAAYNAQMREYNARRKAVAP